VKRATVVVLLVAVIAACDGADRATEPAMVVPQDVPADVAAELETVWSDFRRVFAGRLMCVPDVTIVLVPEVVDGDARYVPSDSRVEIEIPTTPARFRESVAHELAHHVEHGCPEFEELRRRLNDEFWPGSWRSGPVWWDVPSERWAEHVVDLVNGQRVRHIDEVPIDPRASAVIRGWVAGSP